MADFGCNGIIPQSFPQLFPQRGDVHPDRMTEWIDIGPPDVFQQLLLADDPVSMEHQMLQDLKLFSCQGDKLSPCGYLPLLCVQDKRAYGDGRTAHGMKTALPQNDEMASGIPCTGVWYVNGSLISAWISQIDGNDLADSAASFVAMSQENESDSQDSISAIPMG